MPKYLMTRSSVRLDVIQMACSAT